MNRSMSAEYHRLSNAFDSVCRKFSHKKRSLLLDQPLAYWALPGDRCLPLPLLGRTIGDLISAPFADLSSTPSVGEKKFRMLVTLLKRAADDKSPPSHTGIGETVPDSRRKIDPAKRKSNSAVFDPDVVSESLWTRWCETVRRHKLENEKLGRLAPTLQAMPVVVWNAPFSQYLKHSISEVRGLKKHGRKRIGAVLEVFHAIHQMLSQVEGADHLAMRLVPRFVPPIERWIEGALSLSKSPPVGKIRTQLARPLLNQLKVDAGETACKLAEGRLGIRGAPQNVQLQSRRLGVTRARVYQLLRGCGKVMQVRWPNGRWRLAALREKFKSRPNKGQLALVRATQELFYPDR